MQKRKRTKDNRVTQIELAAIKSATWRLLRSDGILRDGPINGDFDDVYQDCILFWLEKKTEAVEYFLIKNPDGVKQKAYKKFVSFYVFQNLRWAYLKRVGRNNVNWDCLNLETISQKNTEDDPLIFDNVFFTHQKEEAAKDIRLIEIIDLIKKTTDDPDIILQAIQNFPHWADTIGKLPKKHNGLKKQAYAYFRKLFDIPKNDQSYKARQKVENIINQIKDIGEQCLTLT